MEMEGRRRRKMRNEQALFVKTEWISNEKNNVDDDDDEKCQISKETSHLKLHDKAAI